MEKKNKRKGVYPEYLELKGSDIPQLEMIWKAIVRLAAPDDNASRNDGE